MTQKDMAIEVADEVFRANIKVIFTVLDNALTLAHEAAAKQAAVDKAKLGLASAQATRSVCRDLANTLP